MKEGVLGVPCTRCGAMPGQPCTTIPIGRLQPPRPARHVHADRLRLARKQGHRKPTPV